MLSAVRRRRNGHDDAHQTAGLDGLIGRLMAAGIEVKLVAESLAWLRHTSWVV
jgi:hypothetical protein